MISKLALALAVAAASLGAVAAPDSERGVSREEMRAQRQAERQSERQNRQSEGRPVREVQPQFDPRGQSGDAAQQAPEGRHGSRMSPEERRALRRQIDQASHDLYPPNR